MTGSEAVLSSTGKAADLDAVLDLWGVQAGACRHYREVAVQALALAEGQVHVGRLGLKQNTVVSTLARQSLLCGGGWHA